MSEDQSADKDRAESAGATVSPEITDLSPPEQDFPQAQNVSDKPVDPESSLQRAISLGSPRQGEHRYSEMKDVPELREPGLASENPVVSDAKVPSTPPPSSPSSPSSSPSLLGEEDAYGLYSRSPMNLTPYSTHTQREDEFVIYSDSDGASQSSLDLRHSPRQTEKPSATDSRTSSASPRRIRRVPRTPGGTEDGSTPKPKRRVRRKSTKSTDGASERSHRSSKHEYPMGTGYTSMPATGKIFRNLLILEESLREQVIQQRALRRKYLTFLAVLCSLIAWISHHLFFVDPKSSSQGTARVVLQFALLALLVTLMLYHLSGEYQKTIVLPRKFLSSTNKGLRQLNVRLVKIKTPWTDSIIDIIREFSLFMATMCLNCLHKAYPSTVRNKNSRLEVFLVSCQSQCQPRIGVSDVKLVLNARSFNTDVREGWELYRSEFWIHEGVRRRNQMLAFLQDERVLDRVKLLKRDKQERKDRRKSNATPAVQETPSYVPSRESSPDQFPIVSTPISSNKLSEQNLKKLSNEYDYGTKEDTF